MPSVLPPLFQTPSSLAGRVCGWLVLLLLALLPASLRGQLSLGPPFTFDDLPTGDFQPVPAGYGGQNWYFGNDVFGVGTALEYSTVSFGLSAPNSAYNAFGLNPIRIEAPTQDEADAFVFTGWFLSTPYPGFDGSTGAAQVRAEGFVGASLLPAFTTVFALPNNTSWVQQAFTDTPVNKLLFTPLDGAGVESTFLQGYIFLDDVSFEPVPEPVVWQVLLPLLLGVFALRRTLQMRRR